VTGFRSRSYERSRHRSERGAEVSGGYAFDRFYFEGDSYSDRNENRIDVDGGPFVVGRIMVRF
jgi:hypothetical protein